MRGTPPEGLERTPGEFLALLDLPDRPTPEKFIAEAAREMARALKLPSNERDGAYALLAADAHLTWACEAALAQGHPRPSSVTCSRRSLTSCRNGAHEQRAQPDRFPQPSRSGSG